jgi:tRNA (cmo5U34)-methyltransferase
MQADQQLRSWSSEDLVAEWVGQDTLAGMLTLPRQLSAAVTADAEVPVAHVLDLGSGPGAYLETFLKAFPRSRGTWVDTSESMEEVAREELSELGDRVTYRRGDIEDLDALALEPAQVVLTSRVVHHLSPEGTQELYRKVYALLEPGGFFFNLDHYGSPEGWEPRYRRIRPQFTGPGKGSPAHRHDYPFNPVPTHLGWLEQAGFEAPDVPWRTFYTALLAAQKPS